METTRTDRRSDRPLEPIRIVDCGIIGESGKKPEANETTKLVGEAKKSKLMQAYGEKDGGDADEIDLEDDDESDGNEPNNENRDERDTPKDGAGEIALDDEEDDDEEELVPEGKLTKKAALQKRLKGKYGQRRQCRQIILTPPFSTKALRRKMTQSRNLNRKEVHAEAARMGSDEAKLHDRKRQSKQDRNAKKEEFDTFVVGKLRQKDVRAAASDDKAEQKRLAALSQPAFDSIRQMNARADRRERGTFGVDDYYNPEGQHANYDRNLKSVRHLASRRHESAGELDAYDPTLANPIGRSAASSRSEKEGAQRLAGEMKRRAEKRANKKRRIELDAEDITSINERNKKFNQKIGRNFDKHTAEIRQNLERGTAL